MRTVRGVHEIVQQREPLDFYLTPNGIFPGLSPTDELEASLLEAQQLIK